ncbi:MAG: hypothetical protein H8M99_06430 [Gloeobacteraceae cyanobacterium ES-bin-144]|nr:hypothetical protein [Verrucomicrobiales bacterium]
MVQLKHYLWLACWFFCTGIPLFAGEFALPAEGPVPFRRDQIPLDSQMMVSLSASLKTLASGLQGKSSVERRAAAQMLALSMALDPGNAATRDVLMEFQKNQHKPLTDPESLAKNRAPIWNVLKWLESPEAGAHGQALAKCLKDVIIMSDPDHPQAVAIRKSGEKGAWKNWIPDLSAYESEAIAKIPTPDKSATPPKPVEANKILLDQAKVKTLLWKNTGTLDAPVWNLALAPLEMSAKVIESGENPQSPFSILIGSEDQRIPRIENTLLKLLQKTQAKLPPGVRVTISSTELITSIQSQQIQFISAPSAVLASAAVTGRAPDAIILGLVDESGKYKLTVGFWRQLFSLGKGSGQRLILPAEASPLMLSMLAMERPEFFLEYEVLLAADFNQVLDLSAKTPAEPLASVTARFKEIRDKANLQDVRVYVTNPFVKQRFIAISQEIPQHFSAKMLLIQATGNRPITVARMVIATEIRRALEPASWFYNINPYTFGPPDFKKIGQTYDLCKAQVTKLERYCEKSDQDLLKQASEVVVALKNLDRATRDRGDLYGSLAVAHGALVSVMKSFDDQISTETGELPYLNHP